MVFVHSRIWFKKFCSSITYQVPLFSHFVWASTMHSRLGRDIRSVNLFSVTLQLYSEESKWWGILDIELTLYRLPNMAVCLSVLGYFHKAVEHHRYSYSRQEQGIWALGWGFYDSGLQLLCSGWPCWCPGSGTVNMCWSSNLCIRINMEWSWDLRCQAVTVLFSVWALPNLKYLLEMGKYGMCLWHII